jgi:protein phosphatase
MNTVLADISVPQGTQPLGPQQPGGCLTYRSVTHCGLVRTQNEDACCVEQAMSPATPPRYLLAIADGLGGHDSGEIASRKALEAVTNEFRTWQGGSPERFVARAVRRANDEVFAATHLQPEWHTMQTTLTAVALEGDVLAIGHVGDCRLYRLRNNSAELLTRDHTMAMELMQLHLISPEQAAEHPGRYQLTRAVGGEPFLRIDTSREKVMHGDTYLLCSDGLWAQISTDDLEQTMREQDINKACDNLVQMALATGAPDNITAVMFHIDGIEQSPVSSPSFWQVLRHHKNH